MNRRQYGTTWNSKRGRINPNPMPNIDMSRTAYTVFERVIQDVAAALPRVILAIVDGISRAMDYLTAAGKQMEHQARLRREAIDVAGIEARAIAGLGPGPAAHVVPGDLTLGAAGRAVAADFKHSFDQMNKRIAVPIDEDDEIWDVDVLIEGDQTMVDLGGGMVVPLAELLEED